MHRAITLLLLAPGIALGQANDDWANRTTIAALPFHVVETQIDTATNESTDPAPPCGGATNTLWYGITTGASPAYVSVTIAGYSYPSIAATVAVYSGAPGAFKLVNGACGSYGQNPFNARLYGVRLEANTSYSIMVGSAFNVGPMQTVDLTVSAAPTYMVTKTADTRDGTCGVADCSLREAIDAANATPGAVLVPAGTYTLALTGDDDTNAAGDLDVLEGMGLYGAGAGTSVIDANHLDRALDLHTSGSNVPRTVMIGDLTLANATTIDAGGGLRAGLSQFDFLGIERVTFSGNSADGGGGGAFVTSRGIVRDCRFTGNSTTTRGGGLQLALPFGFGLDVIGCTFDDNTALYLGTGYGGGISASGTVRVVNSTISGNHAGTGGAGFYADNSPIVIRSSTIVFNDVSGGGSTDFGAGVDLDNTINGTNQLSNNVIAGNTSAVDDAHADCALHGGSMATHHNHVQKNGSCTLAGTGDVTGGDPLVAPSLANHGGPTPTHSLDILSPAIDSGDPAGCLDGSGLLLAFDQRGSGFPRMTGPSCDKGAIENPGNVVFANGFEGP